MLADDVAPPRPLNVAVIGKPNTGKSTLFTALSGIRVRTGNYPGVTIERKIGLVIHQRREIHLIDLPGTYNLTPRSADEKITVDLLQHGDQKLGAIDAILCVVDATQLERGIFLISQLLSLGKPIVVALNMHDVAQSRGIEIDLAGLQSRLGVAAVVPTVAVRRRGMRELLTAVHESGGHPPAEAVEHALSTMTTEERFRWAESVATEVVTRSRDHRSLTDRIDRILTGKLTGFVIFLAVMFLVFQSIFTWVLPVMDWFEDSPGLAAELIKEQLDPGPLRSLVVDGIIAGVGGVLVFVPQIALFFLLLGCLEDSGYMARAALVTDRFMSRFGLSGKSFLPLMSSFACAVPGIMGTRVIENHRDRFITILVAPLMSCSARIPVYILLIEVFVPPTAWLGGLVSLKGIVFFCMLMLGAVVSIPVAWLLGKTWFKGERGSFFMELPDYKIPSLRTVLWKTYDGTKEFVLRAGTLIFAATMIVWALSYYPGDHTERHALQAELETLDETDERREEATEQLNHLSQQLIAESYLGRGGKLIEPIVRPCGWDWRIGMAAIASFPAREVVISTLGTIFSLGEDVDEEDPGLRSAVERATWPDGRPLFTLPVALSVMVFFALCAQCVSTLVIIRKETRSWFWPTFCFVYMTVLAYVGACLTYQIGRQFWT